MFCIFRICRSLKRRLSSKHGYRSLYGLNIAIGWAFVGVLTWVGTKRGWLILRIVLIAPVLAVGFVLTVSGGIFVGSPHTFSITTYCSWATTAKITTNANVLKGCKSLSSADPIFATKVASETYDDSHRWSPVSSPAELGNRLKHILAITHDRDASIEGEIKSITGDRK